MCAIAGIVDVAPRADLRGIVRRMTALQKHRGPDGEGIYSSPHVALGHCRLAILDLTAAGHQPMADPGKRFWITFNGEIYNYLELADELRTLGHAFRGRSDTEVLLAAYQQWGERCLGRLRGMFAFAIWDEQEKRLFAARDRLGIKPFHYWLTPDGSRCAFASELKALLELLPHRRPNERLAREFLAWDLLDHDPAETMIEDVRRLPAGHYMSWDRAGGARVVRYWDLTVSDRLSSPEPERSRLIAEFAERFRDSVSVHLRSDVPVGGCLSGGLDSSAIVCAVAAELRARGQWKPDWQSTFSACFTDPRIDERPYIDVVTRATGTHNYQVWPTGGDLLDDLDTWMWHQEEPVGGTGVYAQFCVARLARARGVKVLLDGQGADEQLAGYRKFMLVYLWQLARSGHLFKAAGQTAAFLSSRDILRTTELAKGSRYWRSSLPESSVLWANGSRPPRPEALGLLTTLGRRLQSDITSLSLPVLLRFEDRNMMAFGVESRVPFVDHVLVEWLATLPADLRLSDGWTKRILRESLTDLLPAAIRNRKTKLGFSTPEAEWISGPLRPWIRTTLAKPAWLEQIVDSRGIARLLNLFERGEASDSVHSTLFRLAMYETWARMFLEADVSRRLPMAVCHEATAVND
jgi:asparagine synthase (glutamine-hydrolysing)